MFLKGCMPIRSQLVCVGWLGVIEWRKAIRREGGTGKLEYCVLKWQRVVFSNKMERSLVRKWAMMRDAWQSVEVQSKIPAFYVCTVVTIFILHLLRATISCMITEKKPFCGNDFILLFILLTIFRPCF